MVADSVSRTPVVCTVVHIVCVVVISEPGQEEWPLLRSLSLYNLFPEATPLIAVAELCEITIDDEREVLAAAALCVHHVHDD